MPALPPWPNVEVIAEQGPSPTYYRATPAIAGLGVRPSIKGVARIGEHDPLARFAFGYDIHAIGRVGLGRGRSLGLWPEVGFVGTGANGRFGSAGIGIASQTPPLGVTFVSGLSFGVVPHVLLGSRDGRLSMGVRTSALAEIYLDDGNAWGIELAHQIVDDGQRTTHEIMLGISLSLLGVRWH